MVKQKKGAPRTKSKVPAKPKATSKQKKDKLQAKPKGSSGWAIASFVIGLFVIFFWIMMTDGLLPVDYIPTLICGGSVLSLLGFLMGMTGIANGDRSPILTFGMVLNSLILIIVIYLFYILFFHIN